MNLGSITRSTQAYNALQRRRDADPAIAKHKPSTKAAELAPADGSNTKDGNRTGTGKVIPHAQFTFNPFDQKSWDVKAAKGSTIDSYA